MALAIFKLRPPGISRRPQSRQVSAIMISGSSTTGNSAEAMAWLREFAAMPTETFTAQGDGNSPARSQSGFEILLEENFAMLESAEQQYDLADWSDIRKALESARDRAEEQPVISRKLRISANEALWSRIEPLKQARIDLIASIDSRNAALQAIGIDLSEDEWNPVLKACESFQILAAASTPTSDSAIQRAGENAETIARTIQNQAADDIRKKVEENLATLQSIASTHDTADWTKIRSQFERVPALSRMALVEACRAMELQLKPLRDARAEIIASTQAHIQKLNDLGKDNSEQEWGPITRACLSFQDFCEATPPARDSALHAAASALKETSEKIQLKILKAIHEDFEKTKAGWSEMTRPDGARDDEFEETNEALEELKNALSTDDLNRRQQARWDHALRAARRAHEKMLDIVDARMKIQAMAVATRTKVQLIAREITTLIQEFRQSGKTALQQEAKNKKAALLSETEGATKDLTNYCAPDFKLPPGSSTSLENSLGILDEYLTRLFQETLTYLKTIKKNDDTLHAQQMEINEIKATAETLLQPTDPKKPNENQKRTTGLENLKKHLALYDTLSSEDKIRNSERQDGTLARIKKCMDLAQEASQPETAELEKQAKLAAKAEIDALGQAAAQSHQSFLSAVDRYFLTRPGPLTPAGIRFITAQRGTNNRMNGPISERAFSILKGMQKNKVTLFGFTISESHTSALGLHMDLPEAYASENVKSFIFHIWK